MSEQIFIQQFRVKDIPDSSYSLYECQKCKVQFWSPFRNPGSEWYEAQEHYRLDEPKVYRGYHMTFLDSSPVFPQGTRVLDIGCGTGELLGELHKRNCEVWGVDSDKRDIEVAKQFFGLSNLYAMPLDDFFLKMDLPLFDIITFFEVLEHLDNPLAFIDNVKKLLKPGGRIIMSVPSRDRMLANLYDWDFPPYHLSRWNVTAISNLFAKIGFKINSIKYSDETMHFLELFTGLLRKMPSRFRPGRLLGSRPEGWLFIRLPATVLLLLGIIVRPVTNIRNGVMVIELAHEDERGIRE